MPTSFAQQRVWLVSHLLPRSGLYNLTRSHPVTGPLDSEVLERALRDVARRHEVLRTTLVSTDGVPMQLIAEDVPRLPVELTDAGPLPPGERAAVAAQIVAEESARPFDLGRGPLLRVRVLRFDAQHHLLVLTAHHVIADAWSMGLVVRELAAHYSAHAQRRQPALPPLGVQYADFAAWQREWLTGDRLARLLAYWRERLRDAPPGIEIPPDRPRPALRTHAGGRRDFQLSAELTAGLRSLSRRAGASLFMTLLAAFQTLLFRHTDQSDVVLGTPIATRARVELEPLIGLFVNMLVLRTDLGGQPSFAELLGRTREVVLDALGHGELPFERLVEELQPERDYTRQPLFQVTFQLLEVVPPSIAAGPLTIGPASPATSFSRFDLELNMWTGEQGLDGALIYGAELFDGDRIERMIDDLRMLLEAVTGDPQRRIIQLPVIAPRRRKQLHVDRNRTVPPPQADSPPSASALAIAAAWADLLGLDRVGVDDDFFRLGGHSLAAMRLVSSLQRLFGVRLTLRQVFDGRTSRTLGRIVDVLVSGRPDASSTIPSRRPADPPVCSFVQERLWFLDRLREPSAEYTVAQWARLRGPLDTSALRAALGEVVARHECLRTTFAAVDGRPVPRIAASLEVPLPIWDLGAIADARREEEMEALARQEARRPFDLDRGPLLRVVLLSDGAGDSALVLAMHHVISDNRSMRVFWRDLASAYTARVLGTSPPAEAPAAQYADYAAWQREAVRDGRLDAELAYWRETLRDAPEVLRLPTDFPRPALKGSEGGAELVAIAGDVTSRLTELAQQEGATPFMALLAGYAALLHAWSGQADMVIGTPVAGRVQPELDGVIGPFLNTLALRVDLSNDPTFAELLVRVREASLGAFMHQQLPFERLVQEVRPSRSLAQNPLVQALLVLQEEPWDADGWHGLRCQRKTLETGASRFDIALNLTPTPDGIRGVAVFRSDLFRAATIARFCRHYESLLSRAAATPDRRLRDLSPMDEPVR
jgi:non-ribosomal peptide synthetase component F